MGESHIIFSAPEVATYYAVRLPKLKQRGAEWRGTCPIHRGRDDNFSVNPATGLWFCHSRCRRGGDILDLEAALTGGDFATRRAQVFTLVGRIESANRCNSTHTNRDSASTAPSKPTRGADGLREIGRYLYTDQDGHLLYEVVRYVKPDGTKAFKQCRPDGRGGVIWNLDGVERVPYRLPKLLNADTVYLPEGEKDVETLEAWGLEASCNPGGSASSYLYARWTDYFRGRHLVILPDNDPAGRKHAAEVAEALMGAAASVRIVELPGLPAKGDVTDWQAAGGTLERFQELTDAAEVMDAAALSELRARWGLAAEETRHQARAEVADDWPKPEPIQSELPPVEAFSEDLLPDSFRPLVADVTERMQVPMDYPAVLMVLCLAGAVNRRAVIQPKVADTSWVVTPNLWGGIIAPPGFMKSPVISAIPKPLAAFEEFWRNEFNAELEDHEHQKEEADLRLSAWREMSKQAIKKNEPVPIRPDNTLAEPVLKRLVTNDATFEKLQELMAQNPAGLLLIRDELTGWLSMLDKPGREGERAFFLECWNGDSPFTVDRIGRGTVHVPHCCVSMLGGIQPGRLRSYLVDALKDGPSNDGLIQRFQLLVWPDTPSDWHYVDRPPDVASEERATRIFRKLVELDAESGVRFRFAPDAQELFIKWLAELEAKIRGEELHPALISHLSKYRSLMPSLALLFELADRAAGVFGVFGGATPGDSLNYRVSLEHTRQAAAWCDYLESHARRIYSCIVSPQLRAAQELADKIKKRRVGADGFFTCRDVYQKRWSGLETPEAVRPAIEILRDAGWLRPVSGESSDALGRGRPTDRYEVNPGVWE